MYEWICFMNDSDCTLVLCPFVPVSPPAFTRLEHYLHCTPLPEGVRVMKRQGNERNQTKSSSSKGNDSTRKTSENVKTSERGQSRSNRSAYVEIRMEKRISCGRKTEKAKGGGESNWI